MRLSPPRKVKILLFLDASLNTGVTGAEIMRATKLSPSSVYPVLHKFEREELVSKRIEDGCPKDKGRPLRHFYTLTNKGVSLANATRTEYSGVLAWKQVMS